MASSKADIVTFLRTKPEINQLNFEFGGLRVYPSAYNKDVADQIDSEQIMLAFGKLTSGADGEYNTDLDILIFPETFDITSPEDQSTLIHECTHAHIDLQGIGANNAFMNEAVAFLAMAFYREALHRTPMHHGDPVETKAQDIARRMMAGKKYNASGADVKALFDEVSTHPKYKGISVLYKSNGLSRTLKQNLKRRVGMTD